MEIYIFIDENEALNCTLSPIFHNFQSSRTISLSRKRTTNSQRSSLQQFYLNQTNQTCSKKERFLSNSSLTTDNSSYLDDSTMKIHAATRERFYNATHIQTEALRPIIMTNQHTLHELKENRSNQAGRHQKQLI